MIRTSNRLSGAAAVALVCLAFAGRAAAEERSAKELYRQTVRATGLVWTPYGRGTGWVVDRERKLMITNHHVVVGEGKDVVDEVTVLFPEFRNNRVVVRIDAYLDEEGKPRDKGVRGRVLYTDPSRDLALIRLDEVPEGVNELRLASDRPQAGERLHYVGNPGVSGALWVYTQGVVRAVVRRQIAYKDQLVDALVVEAQSPTNPGDSGSPVVNDEGDLVGVHSGASRDGRLMSWFIEVSEVRKFLGAAGRDGPRGGNKTRP
jgi:S1-C subfamily serine protease